MAFVYSNWYIVMALLVVAIAALVTIFIMMDKKDRVMIENFINSATTEKEEPKQQDTEVKENEKVNE